MRNLDKDQYNILVELARKDPVVLATIRSLDKVEDPIPVLIDCIRVLSTASKYYQEQLIEMISTDVRKLEIRLG